MITVPNKNISIAVSDQSSEPELDYWPNWVQRVMCISHLCLAFNSSVNFYIYYVKRKALNSGIYLNLYTVNLHQQNNDIPHYNRNYDLLLNDLGRSVQDLLVATMATATETVRLMDMNL